MRDSNNNGPKRKYGNGSSWFDGLIRLIAVLTPLIIALLPANPPDKAYQPLVVNVVTTIVNNQNSEAPNAPTATLEQFVTTPTTAANVASTSTAVPTNTLTATPRPSNTPIPGRSLNSPRLLNVTTSNTCPQFSVIIDWEDVDGDMDRFEIAWGPGVGTRAGDFNAPYPLTQAETNTSSGRWERTVHLVCSGATSCSIQVEGFDASGNSSGAQITNVICR